LRVPGTVSNQATALRAVFSLSTERRLIPLAFVSPRIVEAIANGSAPGDLTITMLARALPHGWAAQEHKLGIT
jgi:hypothetical protein